MSAELWGPRPAVEGLSVGALIAERAARTPDAPYLIDPETGAVIDFAGLERRAALVAHRLAEAGLGPGDAVAYALPNGTASLLTILGALYGGYLPTAVNLVAGPATMAYVLAHSGAKLVVTAPETDAVIGAAAAELETPPPRVSGSALTAPGAPGAPGTPGTRASGRAQAPAGEPASDGLLMYTSGTTGRPKGVVLSHRALLAGGANTAEAHHLTAADRALCVLPLFHINGLCVTVMGALVSGSSLVLPPRFSVSAFWELIASRDCSWFSVVPTQISYLLHDARERPSAAARLRFGRSASAPLSPDVHAAFEARFKVPIIETMGLTETAAQILSNPLPPGPRKIGSPGLAVGNEVRIAAADGTECPRGREGEVWVRGANVMARYKDNPDATGAALAAGGWLRTGDLGRMDGAGYVFITGRLKELIIKGGENIAPREIDDALYAHPDVIEAAAFARPCPDYGQRVEAAVVLRGGSEADGSALIALCHARLGAFKAPDKVHLLADLPKGPSGKIQRLALAEQTERG